MKREPQGLIYMILIEDNAVVALQARGSDVRELCREERFLEDLSRLNRMASRFIGSVCDYALGRLPKRSESGTTKHAALLTRPRIFYSFNWRRRSQVVVIAC